MKSAQLGRPVDALKIEDELKIIVFHDGVQNEFSPAFQCRKTKSDVALHLIHVTWPQDLVQRLKSDITPCRGQHALISRLFALLAHQFQIGLEGAIPISLKNFLG